MVRVVCVAAAMVIAEGLDRVAAVAGELEDAHAPAWFWSFPAQPSAGKKQQERGPEWFWSFRATDPAKARRAAKRSVFFTGSDLWRQGAFLYGGMLWTPAGLDRDGFFVKAIVTRGIYRYHSGTLGNATVIGTMFAATVMPGARFTRGGITATVYAGLDYQVHMLSPDDPGAGVRGDETGLRVAADLWYQPTPATMLAASGTLSTIGNAYAARIASGWRLFDRFYLGPEASVYGADDYWQARLGAHLTGLTFMRLEWQAALGYAVDDDSNRGAYMRLGVSDRW